MAAELSPGVPAEIDLEEFASVGELFERSCGKYGDRGAFLNMGKSLSYAELERLSGHFGAYLQQVLKLPPGSRVALMMPNVLQYPIAMFGALRAGYTVVNCNPLYTARELEHQLKDSGAEAIVIVENFVHTLQEALPRTAIRQVLVTGLGDQLGFLKGLLVNLVVRHVKKMVPPWSVPGHVRFSDALSQGAAHRLEPVKVTHDDIAFLQYTGGPRVSRKARC